MKAVILAAGMGKRLRPITDNIPKAFIPIDDTELIYYSLNNLIDADIQEVLIVTGFMGSYIRNKLGNRYRDIDIKYVSNDEYANTGSMYSLSKTEGQLDEDILLLESDLIYERRAVNILLECSYPDVILTSTIRGSGDEVFIHTDDEGYLNDLGKNIDGKGAIGELVGISKLSLSFLNELYRKAEQDYDKDDKNLHYEEVIFKLSKKYPVKCLNVEDLLWTEIDTNKDLEIARDVIYQKIKGELKND